MCAHHRDSRAAPHRRSAHRRRNPQSAAGWRHPAAPPSETIADRSEPLCGEVEHHRTAPMLRLDHVEGRVEIVGHGHAGRISIRRDADATYGTATRPDIFFRGRMRHFDRLLPVPHHLFTRYLPGTWLMEHGAGGEDRSPEAAAHSLAISALDVDGCFRPAARRIKRPVE